MRGQRRGRRARKEEEEEEERKEGCGKRKESVTLWMGCTTRYRPRCTGEKMEKRALKRAAGRSRDGGRGGGG